MEINIAVRLTKEQQKALLSGYRTIEEFVQRMVEDRANRIMDDIVRDYADEKILIDTLTTEEKAALSAVLESKIVIHPSRLPHAVKSLIVKKAQIKTRVEKIAEQCLMEDMAIK